MALRASLFSPATRCAARSKRVITGFNYRLPSFQTAPQTKGPAIKAMLFRAVAPHPAVSSIGRKPQQE
jgi:hypothetical protein